MSNQVSHYCESFLCERGFRCAANCACSLEQLIETKGQHTAGCECKCRFISIRNGLWGFVCSKNCDEFFSLDWGAVAARCPDRLDKKGFPVAICPNYKGCSNINCKMCHLPGARALKLTRRAKRAIHLKKRHN